MRRLRITALVIGLAAPVALGGGPAATQPAPALLPAPPAVVPPLLDAPRIDRALAQLDGLVENAMARTGVPGIAVAVIHGDEVRYARGFGVRQVGRPEPVDTDTVFQLASVSKPIASTIVAGLVGRGVIDWDDPVRRHDPSFALSDPFVTAHATFRDLLSHGSGLYTGAGDLLEDLGYDRSHILGRLHLQPLDAFRASYNYSNFGYTAAGQAAAVAAGMAWEDLADEVLFRPLGMTRSSYRHADYAARRNRARLHVRGDDGATWRAAHERNPDAEAPAGSASASVADLARYLRLLLARGRVAGAQIIDADALATTHAPQRITGAAREPAGRASFYGLGWNVRYDDVGRVAIGHAGAFFLGAATYVGLLPGEDLGIAVLTNGEPIGVAEGIANGFFDSAQNGAPTVDWFGLFAMVYRAMHEAEEAPFAYAAAPAGARPPLALEAYAGTYANDYYGPLVVAVDGEALSMTLGPAAAPTTWRLTPYDGDTFTFETVGENAVGRAGAAFRRAPSGVVSHVVLDYYDQRGLGTFRRATR